MNHKDTDAEQKNKVVWDSSSFCQLVQFSVLIIYRRLGSEWISHPINSVGRAVMYAIELRSYQELHSINKPVGQAGN